MAQVRPRTYLHAIYPKLHPQIDEALANGYSFREIHDHIGTSIEESRRAGYSEDDIRESTGAYFRIDTPQGYNPFVAQLYEALGALWGGSAEASRKGLDIIDYTGRKIPLSKELLTDIFGLENIDFVREKADEILNQATYNSAYWEYMAKQKGSGFFDEVFGRAIGGFVPWVTQFKLGVPWAAAIGAEEAESKGQNELLGGVLGGLQRYFLGKLFHTFAMLNLPLRAASTGGTMAVDTWAHGGDVRDILQAGITGVIYSYSGKGNIGIKEIRDLQSGRPKYEVNIRSDAERQRQIVDETNEKIQSILEGETRTAIKKTDGSIEIGDKDSGITEVRRQVPKSERSQEGVIDRTGEFKKLAEEEITLAAKEVAEVEMNYSVTKGEINLIGKQVDLPPGADAVIAVLPDGTLKVRATRSGLNYKNAEKLYGEKVKEVYQKAKELPEEIRSEYEKFIETEMPEEVVMEKALDIVEMPEPVPVQSYDFSESYHRQKVNAIKERIEAGERPKSTVTPGDRGEPLITDGIHTWKAYKELGMEPVFEYVGEFAKAVSELPQAEYLKKIYPGLAERFGIGAERANKQTKLMADLIDSQKEAEANVDKLRNLATTDPVKVFRKGNVEALEVYARRVNRDVFIKKMAKIHPFNENSMWEQEGYADAGDFWDRVAGESPESHKPIYDRNWSQVGSLAMDVGEQIDDLVATAYKMSREAYRIGDKEGAKQERRKAIELRRQKEIIVREHNRLKKESDGIITRLKRIAKQENIHPDYRERIAELLSGYDLHKRTAKTLAQREGLKEFLQRMEDEGETVYIPDHVLAKLETKPLNDMTMDELRNVETAVKNLAYLGELKNRLLSEKRRRDFTTVKEELLTSMKENINNFREPADPEGKLPSEVAPKGIRARFKNKIRQIHGATKAEYIFDKLDGFKGRMYEVVGKWAEVFQWRVDAENKEIRMKESDSETLKAIIDPIKNRMRSMIRDIEEVEERKLTRMEVISLYMHSKNPGNRDAIKRGYNLTEKALDNITKRLSPEEIKFANDIMKLVQSKGSEIADVLYALTGERMTMEPNYFPLYRSSETSTKALEAMKEADLFKKAFHKTSVGRKFTIKRVGNADPPDLSFNTVLFHLDAVNHFIANAKPVRDFQKLLYDKDIKRTIEANAGEGAYRELSEWLKDWANPRRGYSGTADKIFGMLRHNTTLLSLGGKVSTSILQPLAYFQLINRIGMRNGIAGFFEFIKDPHANLDLMYRLSPMMKTRMHSWDRDLIDLFNRDSWWAKYPNVRDAAMYTVSLLDLATTAPAWWSAYHLGMKQFGWSQERAVEYADKIVRTTQGSGLQKDLPGVLRGSNFKKQFFMFYTFFSSTYNEVARDVRAKFVGEISTPQLLRSFMWLFIVPTVFESLVRKREEWTPKEFGKNLLSNIGTIFPGGGAFVHAVTNGFNYTPSPTFELPNEIVKTIGSKKIEEKIKHATMLFGYLTGFPARQAILVAQFLGDLISGRDADPTDLIYRKKKKGAFGK